VYNWFVENILLKIGDWLLGTNFIGELRQWRRWQNWDADQIKKLQINRLHYLLNNIANHNPYYRQFQVEENPDPVAQLKQYPLLYKKDIKSNLDNIVTGDRSKLVCEKSSGSSGIQGEVYMSRKEAYASIAIQTFMWEWSGYRLGDNLLQSGITPNRNLIKTVKDFLLNTHYQSAFYITPDTISQALLKYKRKKAFFGGYASGLYAYAQVAREKGLNDISFKSVISWGDKMFPHYRQLIEEQFHCKVFDTYGCTEGIMIAGQCEHGSYHILSPHVYLELLDANGNEVAPGELGYVVVTRLDAYAMPLIRYYLGDLAVKAPEDKTCACGRPFPILEQIIGRDTDIVRTPSGKQLIVHFFTGIFEHIPAIRQFKVVQTELASITIEYIPDTLLFSENILKEVSSIIHEKLGEPFPVHYKKVDFIPPTPSGKPQIIQSTVAHKP